MGRAAFSGLITGLPMSAPELFSFARNKSISVHTALVAENFSDFFQLPLSQEALTQLQELEHSVEHMALTEDRYKWSYIWGLPHSLHPEFTRS